MTRPSGEIRMSCDRPMGEELQAGQDCGEIASHGFNERVDVPRADIQSATYKDPGLTRRRAAELNDMAKPMAGQFEAIVAEAASNRLGDKRVCKLARDLPCAHSRHCA